MKSNNDIINAIKGQLIVSCQALPEEPLHSPFIMGRMAKAAELGGAKGIRSNSVEDIHEIKKTTDLPIIGIIKKVYGDCPVFITPTLEEVGLLYEEGVDIIALDATDRIRPDGLTISEVFPKIRERYPDQLFMADCATFEEGKTAYELGFDFVGTTLCGYTEETKGTALPNIGLVGRLAKELPVPVIAEGGIWTPEQLGEVLAAGAHAAVVGTAITRPMEITQRFAKVIR